MVIFLYRIRKYPLNRTKANILEYKLMEQTQLDDTQHSSWITVAPEIIYLLAMDNMVCFQICVTHI